MKEGPVCDCSDCMLIKFISTVLLSSLFCIQEMCGLRARHHKARSNQTSLYPAPTLPFLVSCGLAGFPVLPVQMGPFRVLLLSCSGDLKVPVSAEIDGLKAHCIPRDAADNG